MTPPTTRPDWLDHAAYPFAQRTFTLPTGHNLNYVDEGAGEPLVMVHGTPTWSYLYRHLITGLRDTYRVIAPDKLGFGLSDKPTDADYTPAAQAERLATFIGAQDLRLVPVLAEWLAETR